jgi:Flp pilus assembly protein TadG
MIRCGTPATDRRGATALEFALVAPMVLTLLIGLLDLGRLFGDQYALDQGVAVAARYAVVNSTSASAATIQSQFTTAVKPLLGGAVFTLTTPPLSTKCGDCFGVAFAPSYQPGATVTVAARYWWTPSSPITLLPAQSLTSSTTLTVQN